MTAHKLTDEQNAIIHATERSVVVPAFAGTGKSSTLRALATERPNETFLYIAYNKPIATEAENTFPSNAVVATAHSLAYKAIGHHFKGKLRPRGCLTVTDLQNIIRRVLKRNLDSDQSLLLAKYSLDAFQTFLYSPDERPMQRHSEFRKKNDPDAAFTSSDVLSVVRATWKVMIDPSSNLVPMTHDGYMKLYQISAPIFRQDTILLDEAQDANGSILAVIHQQRSRRRIFVGDPHQQIYAYRGAVNAMRGLEGFTELPLTQSFRYGPRTADLVSMMLRDYAGEPRAIRGWNIDTEIHAASHGQADAEAIVGRTNLGLINTALSKLESGNPVVIHGGLTRYDQSRVASVYALRYGGDITHRAVQRFQSFEQFASFARKIRDPEMLSAIRLVEERGKTLLRDLDRLDRSCRTHHENPEAIRFLTAHRSKGLEFGSVELVDDFSALHDAKTGVAKHLASISVDEMNLLYVALTRGSSRIHIPPRIREFIGTHWPTTQIGMTADEWRQRMPASATPYSE